MPLPWKRLIRFVATDGRILRGEPILTDPTIDLGFVTESDKLQAHIIEGEDIYDTTGQTKLTNEVATVKMILGPLAQTDVPILRCVGLNYAKHSKSCQYQCIFPLKLAYTGDYMLHPGLRLNHAQ